MPGRGTTIGAGQLFAGGDVVTVAIFSVLAASTVAAPVVAYLFAKQRVTAPLNQLRDWLTQNNATVMSMLMLVIGVVQIGKGIGGLSS